MLMEESRVKREIEKGSKDPPIAPRHITHDPTITLYRRALFVRGCMMFDEYGWWGPDDPIWVSSLAVVPPSAFSLRHSQYVTPCSSVSWKRAMCSLYGAVRISPEEIEGKNAKSAIASSVDVTERSWSGSLAQGSRRVLALQRAGTHGYGGAWFICVDA